MEATRILAQVSVSAAVLFMWWHMQSVVLSSMAIPPENRDMVMRMAGILDANVIVVVCFWIGTSLSSARKDDKPKAARPAKEELDV